MDALVADHGSVTKPSLGSVCGGYGYIDDRECRAVRCGNDIVLDTDMAIAPDEVVALWWVRTVSLPLAGGRRQLHSRRWRFHQFGVIDPRGVEQQP